MVMKNLVLMIIGFTMLGLGIVGVAIPVMPTTPFVLVSAVCFTSSNKRVAGWLERSKLFGGFIQNYKNKTGISKKTKLISLIVLWAGLCISAIVSQKPVVCVILVIVGVCVTIHILTIRTKKEKEAEACEKP